MQTLTVEFPDKLMEQVWQHIARTMTTSNGLYLSACTGSDTLTVERWLPIFVALSLKQEDEERQNEDLPDVAGVGELPSMPPALSWLEILKKIIAALHLVLNPETIVPPDIQERMAKIMADTLGIPPVGAPSDVPAAPPASPAP